MCDRGPLAALLAAVLAALLACCSFLGFWRDDDACSVGTCHRTHACTHKGASRLKRLDLEPVAASAALHGRGHCWLQDT